MNEVLRCISRYQLVCIISLPKKTHIPTSFLRYIVTDYRRRRIHNLFSCLRSRCPVSDTAISTQMILNPSSLSVFLIRMMGNSILSWGKAFLLPLSVGLSLFVCIYFVNLISLNAFWMQVKGLCQRIHRSSFVFLQTLYHQEGGKSQIMNAIERTTTQSMFCLPTETKRK